MDYFRLGGAGTICNILHGKFQPSTVTFARVITVEQRKQKSDRFKFTDMIHAYIFFYGPEAVIQKT